MENKEILCSILSLAKTWHSSQDIDDPINYMEIENERLSLIGQGIKKHLAEEFAVDMVSLLNFVRKSRENG